MDATQALDAVEKFVTEEFEHWKEKMGNTTGFDLVEATARFSECNTIRAMIIGLHNEMRD